MWFSFCVYPPADGCWAPHSPFESNEQALHGTCVCFVRARVACMHACVVSVRAWVLRRWTIIG